MNLDIKYNKTALREFQKKMNVRKGALPTLKNKEAALRAIVFETRGKLEKAMSDYQDILKEMKPWKALWKEYDSDFELLEIQDIKVEEMKVAGIKLSSFNGIEFNTPDFSYAVFPNWYPEGLAAMKVLLAAKVKYQLLEKQLVLLEDARKKATQKVNLYEKVQIPALESAIRQIKRYLEDEDNLSKASQKLLKLKIHKQALV